MVETEYNITPRIIGIASIYNPSEENIEGLLKCAQSIERLLIVDDSEEPYESLLTSCLKRCSNNKIEIKDLIDYSWNCKNLGLATSINRGIKRCINYYSPDWILLLDQDSQFGNDLVGSYMTCIKNLKGEELKTTALIAPLYNYDRHKRIARNGNRRVRFSMMSGSLLNVNLLKKIGLYDERLFIDGMDNEWCLRARRKGYNIVRCSSALLDHHPSFTKEIRIFGMPLLKFGYDSAERYYYAFRSFMLIHSLYHDWYNDLWFLYKRLKSLFLFGDFYMYNKAYKDAKSDYNIGFFGKYTDRPKYHR